MKETIPEPAITSQILAAIEDLSIQDWQCLDDSGHPLLGRAYLTALETSGVASAATGWRPCHLVIRDPAGAPLVLLPLYRKNHSYGEYIFDWSWAEACERAGIAYYPKLVSSIPFTPVTGDKLLWRTGLDAGSRNRVLEKLRVEISALTDTSFHWLFIPGQTAGSLADNDWLHRHSLMFRWHNPGYRRFDDFLDELRKKPRKNIRSERRRLREQGFRFERLQGDEISAGDIRDFTRFYRDTYLRRSGHGGYLNEAFFQQLRCDMPARMLLVKAIRDGHCQGMALCFVGRETLYGRYWGGLPVSGLHFETCYYQGMEYCIEQGLNVFEPGVQGEYKVSRGFRAERVHSLHHLARTDLRDAIGRYISEEKALISANLDEYNRRLPFRETGKPE